jgi:adenylate cyclase
MASGERRVLVVDDETTVRETLTEYLAFEGWDVVGAGSGLDALRLLAQKPFDAVVLDLAMPQLGGLATLQAMRDFISDAHVVVVTAEIAADIHERALALGATAVLTKPASPRAVHRALSWPDPADGRASGPQAPALSTDPAASAPQALIVEDDAALHATLEELLETRGYRTTTVVDGAAAIRQVVQAPPDVVLLDVDLPSLSGMTVLAAIRALAPKARIIMMSGVATDDARHRAANYGAADFLLKPVRVDVLERSLETALA